MRHSRIITEHVAFHSEASYALTTLAMLMLAACGEEDKDGAGGPSTNTCWPSGPGCGLDGVGRACMAWHDNAGSSTLSFRMSQLEVIKPDVLAGQFLQDNVVTKGVALNLPQCFQEGSGRFSWLLEFDTANQRVKTGGAHVQLNPANGYCYINQVVEGFQTQPMEVPLKLSNEGGETLFELSETIKDITVAIYLTDDESSAIILPLHEVMMSEGRISSDGNCIGAWDGDHLYFDNDCKPDRNEGQKMQWVNGARLTGYIELEESDDVWIPEMTQTLCVALSGSALTYGEDFKEGGREGKRCARDDSGKIKAAEKADWCAASNTACSQPEADAFRLEGKFAASAVKVLASCP